MHAIWEFFRQIRACGEGEGEQALIRVGLISGAFCYLLVSLEPRSSHSLAVLLVAGVYFLFSLWVIHACVVRPGPVVARRMAVTAVDLAAVTYVLIAAGAVSAPIYGAYLWIVIGNGMRFGTGHLRFAHLLSLVGFGLVLIVSPYWNQHLVLGTGLFVWLGLLPKYVEVLRTRMDEALFEARAANRAKSQFLSNMNHELKTPLNAIIGFSELLRSDAESAGDRDQVEQLRSVERSGYQLLGLINQVLDLARAETGEMQAYPEVFAVEELVRQSLDVVAGLAKKNGNTLDVIVAPDAGIMYADPEKVRQILVNLLGNACKFTHDGHVNLIVDRTTEDGTDWIQFRVSDTGVGIAANQLPNIFKAFSQGDASVSRCYGGTGLGLTICKRFCELMGGRIEVHSEPQRGSVFTACLPVGELETHSPAMSTRATAAG